MKREPPAWERIALDRSEDGVVEARLHSDGSPMIWDATVHRELAELFAWLAFDRRAKVLLLVGTGDDFCTQLDSGALREMSWREIWSEGCRLVNGLLALDMLVVTAVNGPAHVHSEIAVAGDIVLACPEATLADKAHFIRDVVPGDGVHSIWSRLIGPSRASYFLLTGKELPAEEAYRLGVYHELHPRDALVGRARALCAELARRSPATIEYSRNVFQAARRREIRDELGFGLAVEGLAQHAMGLRKAEDMEQKS